MPTADVLVRPSQLVRGVSTQLAVTEEALVAAAGASTAAAAHAWRSSQGFVAALVPITSGCDLASRFPLRPAASAAAAARLEPSFSLSALGARLHKFTAAVGASREAELQLCIAPEDSVPETPRHQVTRAGGGGGSSALTRTRTPA